MADVLAFPGEESPVDEAAARLNAASKALSGFASLLAGYESDGCLKADEMYALLSPIEAEVAAARDCLWGVGR